MGVNAAGEAQVWLGTGDWVCGREEKQDQKDGRLTGAHVWKVVQQFGRLLSHCARNIFIITEI